MAYTFCTLKYNCYIANITHLLPFTMLGLVYSLTFMFNIIFIMSKIKNVDQ